MKPFNKHGQLKIQQMAFMLMAVTLFFVLVALFVIIMKFSGLKETGTALEEKNAMLLVTKLANSPEFACGRAFGNAGTNCVDADKVMMLRENIAKYRNFWGSKVTNIEIRKIYPLLDKEILCTSGNYPNCNVIRVISGDVSGFYIGNFISLCHKNNFEGEVYDKCELAKLFVSYKPVEQ